MARLKALLTENLPLKMLALALAFVVWASLARQEITEILIGVPIEFRNVPAGMLLSADPVEAQLLLRGPRTLLRRTRPEQIHLQVDLQSQRVPAERVMALTPEAAETPAAIEVLHVRPAQIAISLFPAPAGAKQP